MIDFTPAAELPDRASSSRTPSRFFKHLRRLCLLFTAAVTVLGLAAPASADLVIFTDGDFIRIETYSVQGKKIRLELPSGGALVLPLRRVSRVIDDRVDDDPEALDATAPLVFPLRFDPDHGVPDGPFGELIHESAERHGLNPALVSAVVRAESAYRPEAVSVKGARGLMQLMPATAERFGLDPALSFEPALNVDAGCRYLRWLADKFDDDLTRVLAAYNSGEGTVARYGGVPPYRETRGYLRRIYNHLGLKLVLEPIS